MDVQVLVNRSSFPGCLIEVRPIGVLNMAGQKERRGDGDPRMGRAPGGPQGNP
jgi:inorganic pyrophosphatase